MMEWDTSTTSNVENKGNGKGGMETHRRLSSVMMHCDLSLSFLSYKARVISEARRAGFRRAELRYMH
jgi:hypothetical protein